MQRKRVYIFVNGIRTRPGASENWTGRAVTWSHTHSDVFAEKIEYFTLAITRPFGQKKRFLNEIRTLRELGHTGIPRIYNDGRTAEGAFYYTMALQVTFLERQPRRRLLTRGTIQSASHAG